MSRKGQTHMLMHTPINPPPPVRNAVSRVTHVGAGIETPGRGLLSANTTAAAEQGPDHVGSRLISRGVLLKFAASDQCTFSLNGGRDTSYLIHVVDQ